MSCDVTVVICTWNRAALLDQTLTRMAELHIPPGMTWEVLVVNNNCTDQTDQVVRAHEGRLPLVLCHEPRPGKVYALNHALARAEGRFLLFTDDDVLAEPDWVVETLKGFDDFQADMVFGKVVPWWETAPPPWYSELFR